MDYLQAARTVEIVLIWIVVLLIIFDIYLYLNKTDGDTISNILKNWVNDKFFFISYLWGVLAGHFFLGTTNPPFDNTIWSLAIVLSFALILVVAGVILKKRIKPRGQVVLLFYGLLIGHFFWSLNCKC